MLSQRRTERACGVNEELQKALLFGLCGYVVCNTEANAGDARERDGVGDGDGVRKEGIDDLAEVEIWLSVLLSEREG